MTTRLFAWDQAKNRSNLRKHGVSFETASRVFDDPLHVSVQDRVGDGEERWLTLGRAGGVTVLVGGAHHHGGRPVRGRHAGRGGPHHLGSQGREVREEAL